MDSNRRLARRVDAFRIGSLTFADSVEAMDCLVWDQSETGAQIEVEAPDAVPDRFTLLITPYAKPRSCIVAWRRQRRLGVSFENS